MKTQQLKIEKLILESCPNGVKFMDLGFICRIKTGQSVNKIMIDQNKGIHPVINSGRDPLGYINTYNTENDPIGITSRGAGVGSITWCEGKYFRGNLNYSVTIFDKNILNLRYLYFVLMDSQKQINELSSFNGIPALNASNLVKFKIPIPPLTIQEEIVKILNNFTELEAELQAELEARNKQYEHYRSKLLTSDNIQKINLSGISTYSKTRIEATKLNNENYVGVDNLLQNRQGKTISTRVPVTGKLTHYENGDILIGNIRPYLKKIWYATNVGGTNGDVLVVRIKDKEKVNSKFLYYLLSSDKFFDYNMQFAKGAKMPRGDKSSIMKFEIAVPSMSEQTRIVAILDKFDTLVNDISIGLPAELKARKRQYEYYRNKLLTFNELKTVDIECANINKTS
jgi:type I restriction enzyme S subunit